MKSMKIKKLFIVLLLCTCSFLSTGCITMAILSAAEKKQYLLSVTTYSLSGCDDAREKLMTQLERSLSKLDDETLEVITRKFEEKDYFYTEGITGFVSIKAACDGWLFGDPESEYSKSVCRQFIMLQSSTALINMGSAGSGEDVHQKSEWDIFLATHDIYFSTISIKKDPVQKDKRTETAEEDDDETESNVEESQDNEDSEEDFDE